MGVSRFRPQKFLTQCPRGATGLAVETGAEEPHHIDLNGEIDGTQWSLTFAARYKVSLAEGLTLLSGVDGAG